MSNEGKPSTDRNQGEGDRESARRYNKDTRDFKAENDVAAKAREAKKALSGEEAAELREAEQKGKAEAREEDPQVRRDR